ncbi:ATP-dependent DNA ligase [Aeromicrobium wangtongii]|uniref:ATP-dependent DNA ligase n=1 Tax=Aeromicrobium wangtongii TaxID=2969247 RepID=A0ABY5M6T2_9ACTN|nr:ATP-dependent DNA ligase [Aeromicrobium wangtongii]MCD9199515.1 ATP-dependent DNA ligase [Aeromicrobium wangtongii]UUP13868.1 ATP-dependent DNA ligase [Aeromicrobium wangtongii]
MNLPNRRPSAAAASRRGDRWNSEPDPPVRDAAQEVENSLLTFPQQPMLARSVPALPDEDGLPGGSAYEPKFDGYRALIFVMAGWCRIQSRYGRDITASFPEIVAAVSENVPAGVVLDGELVVWGDDTSDFTELHRRLEHGADLSAEALRPASFVAFDVLAGAGMDLRKSPFRVRRQALTILLDDTPAPLHVVPQTRDAEEARTWLVNYSEAHVGIDGVIAKGLATGYLPGERGWERVAIRDSVECVVGAVMGTLRGPTRLLLGVPDHEGNLRLVGGTTDITLPQSRRIGRLLTAATGDHPWADRSLADIPGWSDDSLLTSLVEPTTVVEVASDGSSPVRGWAEPHELIRLRPELRPEEIEPVPF